ncbi:hypothetical protein E4U38_008390 [Claviceps purpurea]|nr:hypothetical protein E4U12_000393 [Claviceps purpurea]KAG6124549.1 hypothetical protein E4U38_008390 [Claviceps purpurea]
MDSTRRSTRASSRRAESQPAPAPYQQVPRVTETPSPQHRAPDSDTAMVLHALATQVTSLTKKLDGMQDENSVLRKMFLSSQTPQESPVAHTGKSGHFTKPVRFTGKNLTITRAWWATVIFYLDANTDSLDTDMIKINWVGSLLADLALVWHIHRADRHAPPHQPDTWTSYSKAFKVRFTDKAEDSKNYTQMMELQYKGDTDEYLTQFLELNTSGQALGLGERRRITRVLPREIVRMADTWNRGKILSDDEFIETLMEAGFLHENSVADEAADTSTRPKHRQPSSKPDKDTPKSIVGRIWSSLKEALTGIVQAAIDQRKADGLLCWRCGRDSHHTLACFAKSDVEGRDLPPAPQRSPGSTSTPKAPGPTSTPRVAALKRQSDDLDDSETPSKTARLEDDPPTWWEPESSDSDF